MLVWCSIGYYRFSAIHFRGRMILRVRCYTIHSGFLPLGPPPRCPYHTEHPFVTVGYSGYHYARLTTYWVDFPFAVTAYQYWPTRGLSYNVSSTIKHQLTAAFIKSLRLNHGCIYNHGCLNTLLYHTLLMYPPAILREISGGTSY